jgi:hypothetical protein
MSKSAAEPATNPALAEKAASKSVHYDHKYERGAWGVCKRCGGEKHPDP